MSAVTIDAFKASQGEAVAVQEPDKILPRARNASDPNPDPELENPANDLGCLELLARVRCPMVYASKAIAALTCLPLDVTRHAATRGAKPH